MYNALMHCSAHRSAAWTLFTAALFALIGNAPILQAKETAAESYPETIAVLHMLYGSEVRAREHYLAFSDAALKEGHINIAHMLKAIAASEHVHAGNFKRILKSLGVEVQAVDLTSIKVSTTKENLRYTTEVELSEIDKEYPRYIHRISPELHKEALEYINYAWEAERQHRELIKEIESGTGMFFNVLLQRFKKNVGNYYVNQNCGATVHELPEKVCPVTTTSPFTPR
ncbi:MAG: rubrerythrin family protein, partial [Mariprofundus sp.]